MLLLAIVDWLIMESLFSLPWFSRGVFSGLDAYFHEGSERALEKEGAFMSELVLALLDKQRSSELFNPGLYDFYAFCQPRVMRSFSQILQDLWVLYMMKERVSGYFVEFGACDGVTLSNTCLLERDYGWHGILAEPNVYWHEQLSVNRNCIISHKCVAPHSGNQVLFSHVPTMPELSRIYDIVPDDVHEHNGNRSIVENSIVETVSLLDLLREHNAPRWIDYLSVDTEGSEFSILKDFDFDEYSFRLISVEHAGDDLKRIEIKKLLESHGYIRWRPELTRWDDWYMLKDGSY